MPEINNALALQIKPPEAPHPLDIGKTLGVISQLQLSRAHAGLYSLQAAQEARKLHGLGVFSQTLDPVAGLQAGADPSTMSTAQEMQYKARGRGALAEHGPAALGGDPTALGAIVAQNPEYAREVATTQHTVAQTGEVGVKTQQAKLDYSRERGVAEATYIKNVPQQARPLVLQQRVQGMVNDGAISLDEGRQVLQQYALHGDAALDAIIARGKKAGEAAETLPTAGPRAGAVKAAEESASAPYKTTVLSPGQTVKQVWQPGSLPGGFSPTPVAQQPMPGASPVPSTPAPVAPATPAWPTLRTGLEGMSLEDKTRLERLGAEAVTDFGASRKSYAANGNLVQRLDTIDHDIDALGPSWMSAGTGAKAQLAKSWNSTVDTIPGISQKTRNSWYADPAKVASWEEFNKQTVRAGMELIKSNFGGSREAASIIQMGTTAVPSVQNSYLGAKYVSATIRAATRREMELHEYKASLLQPTADVLPKQAVRDLLAAPGTVKHFDKTFGSGLAEFILESPAAQPLRERAMR